MNAFDALRTWVMLHPRANRAIMFASVRRGPALGSRSATCVRSPRECTVRGRGAPFRAFPRGRGNEISSLRGSIAATPCCLPSRAVQRGGQDDLKPKDRSFPHCAGPAAGKSMRAFMAQGPSRHLSIARRSRSFTSMSPAFAPSASGHVHPLCAGCRPTSSSRPRKKWREAWLSPPRARYGLYLVVSLGGPSMVPRMSLVLFPADQKENLPIPCALR